MTGRRRPHGLMSAALGLLALNAGFDWPGRGAQLLAALDAADTPRDRRDALRALRTVGDGDLGAPLAPLEAALDDTDAAVRAEALRTFAALRDDTAPILRALDDPAPEVRATAVSLMTTRDGARAPSVSRACGDKAPIVRIACARGLATARDRETAPLRDTALADSDPEVRLEALRALGAVGGEDARDALMALANDPLPELRAAALEELARAPASMREATLTRALSAGLDDPDALVRLAALRGGASVSEAQLEALRAGPSRRVATAAAYLLAAHASPPAQAWLAPLERTAAPWLSSAEAHTIVAQLERTLPPGTTLATDPLVAFLPQAPTALWERLTALIDRAGSAVRGEGLLDMLDVAPPHPRRALIALLARARGRAVVDALIAQLDQPDSEVWRATVDALARTLDGPGTRTLIALLDDRHGAARRPVLAALAAGLPRTHAKLERRARAHLARTLARELVGHDPAAAASAATALGWLGDPGGDRLLREAARTAEPLLAIAALRASLRDHGPEARSLRRTASEHEDPRIAATAIVARALAGDDRAPLASLLAALEGGAWPRGPAAAFALADAVIAGVHVDAATARGLCDALRTREPATRTNLKVALAQSPEASCPEAQRTSGIDTSRRRAPLPRPGAGTVRALILADGRVLLAITDASGDAHWPVSTIDAQSPEFWPYARE